MDNTSAPIDSEMPTEAVAETAALAAWSPQARRWLRAALTASALAVVTGLAFTFGPMTFTDVLDVLKPVLGVALVLIGSLLGLQTYRLLTRSGPDHPYRPGDVRESRTVFVLIWLAGSVVSYVMSARAFDSTRLTFIVGTGLGVAIAGAGAWWVARWLGAKSDKAWSMARKTGLARPRLREWSAVAAFAWGIGITLFVIGAELVLDSLLGSSINVQLTFGVVSPGEILDVLRSPPFVLIVLLSYVVVAPLVEEGFKAAGLRALRGAIHSHSDGIMLGMLIGLGFGFVESSVYVTVTVGGPGTFVAAWARTATIVMHGAATGLAGAGYAASRLTGDRRHLWSGLKRAFLAHALWNAVAVGLLPMLMFITPTAFGVICCLGLALLAAFLVLALRVVPRLVSASIEKAVQDDHALADAPLPGEWSPTDEGIWWRLAGGRPQYAPLADAGDDPLQAIVSGWRR